jgi:hypothetical protein
MLAPQVRAQSRRKAMGCQRSWARYMKAILFEMIGKRVGSRQDMKTPLKLHTFYKPLIFFDFFLSKLAAK